MEFMRQKRAIAESTAKRFYDNELKSLKANYTDKLITNLEQLIGPSYKIGEESAKNLAKGFDKNKHEFLKGIRDVLKQMRNTVQSEVDATLKQSQAKLNALKVQMQNVQAQGNNINVYAQAQGASPYQEGMQMGRAIDRELRRRGI